MNERHAKKLLYTVTDSGVIQEYYDVDEVAKFQLIADQWRIITYESFSEQRILKGKDLLKAVYEHRKCDIRPISTDDYAVRDGELCGFVKELGCCDINGGMGGWKGIRKSVIHFTDSDRTLYDFNRFDYKYSTRDEYTYEAYALVPLESLREIAAKVV